MKSKTKLPSPAPPAPELSGIVKTSPRGRKYRVYTVSLSLLPQFLEKEKLDPKVYFYYIPERDYFLGCKRKEE
jgi:hypothetical protein